MKQVAKLLEHVAKVIKNGDIKITLQDGVGVKASFRVNDKENILTLEDIKGSE